jgi:NAD(P) transhydrogenase subunit alpha
MKIAIPRERRPGEKRVAASPDSVKKFIGLGFEVAVEAGAGLGSAVTDEAFKAAGASIVADAKALLQDADLVLKIARPMMADEGTDEVALLKKGAILCCHLQALTSKPLVEKLASAGVTAFAMELVPRITRAQSMDILSSQANLAGYRAVIDAASAFGRAFPMMMTAAGTVAPAKVLVIGAGVAGLQAIATAKRLGAVVFGYDVRAAAKEQVESLGGKFVMVDEAAMKEAETSGGYAKEMSEDYKRKQAEVLAEAVKKADIVICTALIPGKKAPLIVTGEMVKSMRPGSVILDMAVEMGGNAEGSEQGKVVEKNGITFIGYDDLPSRVAVDASTLFAKNLLNFIQPLVDKETKAVKINLDDEVVKGSLVAHEGKIVHPALAG